MPAELQRRDESLLKAVGGIGMVAQQPIRSLPNGRTVLFDNHLPVNHLQAPLETFLAAAPATGRHHISRRRTRFYYRNFQLSAVACRSAVAFPEEFDILSYLQEIFLAMVFAVQQNSPVVMLEIGTHVWADRSIVSGGRNDGKSRERKIEDEAFCLGLQSCCAPHLYSSLVLGISACRLQ